MKAAAALLAEGGREAVSSRAVSAAAGVQAPTIYRQFGDMRGLLEAVAHHGFTTYLKRKAARAHVDDAVEDLRRGWDLHVEFGLANPGLYKLMYGDATPGTASSAAMDAEAMLRGLVQRVAEAGRLRVSVERAAQMISAAGIGVTLTLIGTPTDARDLALSSAMREAVLAAVTAEALRATAAPDDGPNRVLSRAVALKAVLHDAATLTPAESDLLVEWLDRLAEPATEQP